MDKKLEAKLREIIDRDEIWRVLQRYARGLDRMDVDLVRSCYFDDCTEDHGHYIGDPDGFIQWANETAACFKWTHHSITTHYCELDGDDAHAETYFIYTGVNKESPHFMSTGRYLDHLQRRHGEWRFANRVVIVEATYDVSEAASAALTPPDYAPDELYPASRDKSDVSYQRPLRPREPRSHG